jgi:hypothetical protein
MGSRSVVSLLAVVGVFAAGCGGGGDATNTGTPPSVRVPSVIGQRSAAARESIEAQGLTAHFRGKGDICTDPWPDRRVTGQRPPPGTDVPRGDHVQVEAHCAIEPCRVDQLHLTVGGSPGLTGGGDALNVSVKNSDGPACQLNKTLNVTVLDPTGASVGGIHGNPVSTALHWRLGRDGSVYGILQWSNWCGDEQRMIVAAQLTGNWMTNRIESPSCLSKGHASGLGPLSQAGHWLYGSGPAYETSDG